jgi:hypothetical protein
MKNIIIIIVSLFLFIIPNTSAQRSREKAYANITMLKNGALFVRLRTSELKINALKKIGDEKQAEEIRVAQENSNKSIIAAFKANFTFCKVYFFYSNHSNEVKAGNYKGFVFDAAMNTTIDFTGTNYFIGEYDEGKNTQIDAFIIKDKNYEPLKSPFPYLIKQNVMLVSTRSDDSLVIALNKKLFDFYGKQP